MHDLIAELDPLHQGDVSYEEFILIMKYIEQKGITSMPEMSMKQSSMQ